MANLSLEVVLELVDRLTGPARDAIAGLEQFGAAARQAAGADSGLRPDRWIEERSAINDATQAAKQFAGAATGATDAGKGVDTSWIELAGTIDKAIGAVDLFKGAAASAAEAGKGVDSSWLALTADVDMATAAVERFASAEEAAAGKGLGGGGGGPGAPGGRGEPGGKHEPGPVVTALENGFEMLGLFEGPKAIETIIAGGAHLTDETIAQRIAGMSPEEIDFARKQSVDLQAKFPQFKLDEIIKQTTEARAILNSDEEAREALPEYLRAAALQDRTHPGEGLKRAYPLMRAIEEAGAPNIPGKTHEMFDAFQKAINVFGEDKIPPHFYQDVFQHAGMFGRTWDMEFIRDKLPHLVASLGGDATGTMLATLGMAVKGGHVMGPSLRAFDELGLLDQSKVHRKKSGLIEYIDPNAIMGGDILDRDPMDWVNQKLWAAVQKKTSDPVEQDALLAVALSNRNDLKAGYMAIHDRAGFERDKNLIEPNIGLGASDLLKGDPLVGWQAVKSSAETLAGVSSEPAMGAIAQGLDLLSGALVKLSHAAADNPGSSVEAAGATVAGILTLMGKGIGMLGRTMNLTSAESAGHESWLSWGMRGAALATVPLAIGNIAEWTPPEDQKVLDAAIRRENAEAAFRLSHEARDEASAGASAEASKTRHYGQGPHGAFPVDTSSLDAAADKAKTTGAAIKAAIEQPVSPHVNMGVLDALEAKLRSITSLMGQINGFGGGGRASAPLYDHVPGGH